MLHLIFATEHAVIALRRAGKLPGEVTEEIHAGELLVGDLGASGAELD